MPFPIGIWKTELQSENDPVTLFTESPVYSLSELLLEIVMCLRLSSEPVSRTTTGPKVKFPMCFMWMIGVG